MVVCDLDNDHISRTTIRCLHRKQNVEHFFEYTDQFWRKYPNNRKLSVIINNHGHEIRHIDDFIYNFLNNLFNDNLLKDTTVFLISDHGAGMSSIYTPYDFFQREIYLPMLYILMNDRKNMTYEEQYGNLFENQQTYITHLDVFNTFGHLLYGDKYVDIKNNSINEDTFKSEYGISLFNKINSKERYQEKFSHIYPIQLISCKKIN
mgnify:CR=1 FL=1